MSICTCPVEGVGHWPGCARSGLLTDVAWDELGGTEAESVTLAARRLAGTNYSVVTSDASERGCVAPRADSVRLVACSGDGSPSGSAGDAA